jgi:hypothetical protein
MPDNWTSVINGEPLIRELATRNHPIGGNLCTSCPKGLIGAIRNPNSRYKPFEKNGIQRFIDQYFDKKQQDAIHSTPCWLDENQQAMRSPQIAISQAGLGPSDLICTDAGGESQHRGLIVDETRQGVMGRVMVLSFSDIGKALDDIEDFRLRAVQKKSDLIWNLPNARTVQGEDSMRAEIDRLSAEIQHGEACGTVYKSLHASLAEAPDNEWCDVPPSMTAAIDTFLSSTTRQHTHPHERPSWETLAQLRRLPVRMLEIIAESIRRGSASILPGRRLAVAVPSQLFEIIEGGDHPLLIADATPDPTLAAILAAKGAKIETLRAKQNVIVFYDHRRYRGAGPSVGKNGLPTRSRDLDEAEARRKMREARYSESAVKAHIPSDAEWVDIGNKKAMIPLLALKSGYDLEMLEQMPTEQLRALADQHNVGWFGLHDRAHDRWTGKFMHVWGDPTIPDAEAERMYVTHRALLIHAGLPALPHWQNKWLDAHQHEIEMDGHLVSVPRRVHAIREIRDYIQKIKDSVELQVIGRLRAANSDVPLVVLRHGGSPNASLDAQGIRSIPLKLDPSPTADDKKSGERERAFARINAAMADIVANNGTVSRKNLREWQKEHQQEQTSPGTYRAWLASHHALPFAEWMAKTGRGAAYARAIERALCRGPADLTADDIGDRIDQIRQAQIKKGGVLTDETVLRGMLADADLIFQAFERGDESMDAVDMLAAEVLTTVATGDGLSYITDPPTAVA